MIPGFTGTWTCWQIHHQGCALRRQCHLGENLGFQVRDHLLRSRVTYARETKPSVIVKGLPAASLCICSAITCPPLPSWAETFPQTKDILGWVTKVDDFIQSADIYWSTYSIHQITYERNGFIYKTPISQTRVQLCGHCQYCHKFSLEFDLETFTIQSGMYSHSTIP